ncbi:cytochrome C [Ectothiorhodospiraceae bacterium BW-2]|nr:cytochrome C [Ectothiorhodospiraceae bacterium BW-2]
MFSFITRHVLMALMVGGVAGVIFMVVLLEFDHYTSSVEFCTTCHSMELVAEPYYQSSHYNPASGVRAECGDCHVSEGVFAATWDHLVGSKDLYKQLFGPDYDDPVVNKLHLPDAAFAAREWFRKRDSATCSRCHTIDAIVGTRPATQLIHQQETEGKSCIDCHYNLVHTPVPHRKVFDREAWNRQIEEEFGLEAGSSDTILEQGKRL